MNPIVVGVIIVVLLLILVWAYFAYTWLSVTGTFLDAAMANSVPSSSTMTYTPASSPSSNSTSGSPSSMPALTNALPAVPPTSSPDLPPSVLAPSTPQYLGCYKDTQTRAMSSTVGVTTWDACATAARAAGAKYFGMQWPEGYPGTGKAHCFYSDGTNTSYQRYGTNTNCNIKDSGGNALGGYWSNSVYQL